MTVDERPEWFRERSAWTASSSWVPEPLDQTTASEEKFLPLHVASPSGECDKWDSHLYRYLKSTVIDCICRPTNTSVLPATPATLLVPNCIGTALPLDPSPAWRGGTYYLCNSWFSISLCPGLCPGEVTPVSLTAIRVHHPWSLSTNGGFIHQSQNCIGSQLILYAPSHLPIIYN